MDETQSPDREETCPYRVQHALTVQTVMNIQTTLTQIEEQLKELVKIMEKKVDWRIFSIAVSIIVLAFSFLFKQYLDTQSAIAETRVYMSDMRNTVNQNFSDMRNDIKTITTVLKLYDIKQ